MLNRIIPASLVAAATGGKGLMGVGSVALVTPTLEALMDNQIIGPTPGMTLQQIVLRPIPFVIARELILKKHYLHSIPGGTKLTFGVFLGSSLLGAITFGAGPSLAYRLVRGAAVDDCLALTRLWLSEQLPHNSESRVIGTSLRALKRFTAVKFLVTYADPAAGHTGIIYQSTNWLYTGLSDISPLYDLGDGVLRHSRTLGYTFGSHSRAYFLSHGIALKPVWQPAKHRYVYFLDPSWKQRLKVPALPYPKKELSI
jgi:hypothetical protein